MLRPNRYRRAAWMALLLALLALGAFASSSSAAVGWSVTARTLPTNPPPGGRAIVAVNLWTLGARHPEGTITMTDTLPPGLTAEDAGDLVVGVSGLGVGVEHHRASCRGTTIVTCTLDSSAFKPTSQPNLFQLAILVHADPGLSGTVLNRVTVAGGGASTPGSTTEPITVSSSPAGWGFAGWNVTLANADGTIATQAGSHPFEAIFSVEWNNKTTSGGGTEDAGGEPRNLTVNLPPGLIGDPNATVQCTAAQLNVEKGCPLASQVGFESTFYGGSFEDSESVFNMVPPPGVPAEFAFQIGGIDTLLNSGPRTGGDYGITTHVNDIRQNAGVSGNYLTLWGVPGDPRHDRERGFCRERGGTCPVSEIPTPLLTMPTQCAGPQTFSIQGNTWQDPNVTAQASFLTPRDSNGEPTGMTGCESLHFEPGIALAPDTSSADTPAGLTAEVTPQVGGLLEPEGFLSTSDVQNTKVVLPAGVAINPGQAAGLVACQSWQDAVGTEGTPSCPSASRVGTVEITTPLLPDRLQGNVYILQSNPPHLQLLVAASADGVNLKLIGHVELDPTTGQLTTTFTGTPQLPFTDFKLSFSGGAQAALVTPPTCGLYSSSSDFTPWSSPFVADVLSTDTFAIASGPGGTPCASPLPFSPSMIAGSTTDQAGGFTNFSLLLQRADGQQRIEKLQFKVPEGLLGMISKVPLCQEAQAAAGTCSSASQIGHTVVASGPGPFPLIVPQPGQPPAPIYLTGPYKGAPYGLSIVVPLVVGPFTLETQIVRSKIEVDPHTAQITVTTDPLPQIIDGVPADLRTINAVIDRPGFMFNPTNCSPMSFSGTAFSAQGATAAISSPFQMGSCRSLSFKPDFRVSTSGKTSRAKGASLDAKILYPTVPLGNNQASSQSNIKSVKVNLPKQLPSRLTTLQKACAAATFEANPALCPADSRVGTASAVTPVLPVTLSGPAYFVSYGGAKFPELVFVLQGYGVTIYLHGETFISKAGITSSTFRQVPDVPISSFELKLPEGPFSALAANGNLCKSKLAMPTAFTAQDGAVIHQSTKIAVTGCPKPKKKGKKK